MPRRFTRGPHNQGLHAGDSISNGGHAQVDRKTAQLCHQVLETLEQVLAEQEDEILQGLHVLEVVAAPDDSHLLITVAPGPGTPASNGAAILGRLAEAAPDLRIEVAHAITRKRAPSFSFKLGALPGI